MSKTKYVKLKGKLYWAKVFEQNRDTEGYQGRLKKFGGQTCIDVVMTQDEFEKLEASGSKKEGRFVYYDDNGELVKVAKGKLPPRDKDIFMLVKFDRKWKGPIINGEEAENLGREPRVLHSNGDNWDLSEDGFIGNGSEGQVTVSVREFQYTDEDGTKKDTASTKLEEVKVLELVKFEPEEKKEEEKQESNSVPDDEIPFDQGYTP